MDKLRLLLSKFGYRIYASISVLRPRSIRKAFFTLKEDGLDVFKRKIYARIQDTLTNQRYRYQEYLRSTRPTEQQLEWQRKQLFKSKPVFGIIVPLYKTQVNDLRDLLDSFIEQTYSNFKLFLVDASPVKQSKTSITDLIQEYAEQDDRLAYTILNSNDGISANTNRGIEFAMQDKDITHIGLCDHDDFIEPDTLYEYAKVLNEHPSVKIIYSDEDIVRFKGDKAAYFVCKPDFNLFQLESCNYINHFFVCEKSLLRRIKTKDGLYERSEFDGAQDYDLYLRLVMEALKIDSNVLSNKHSQAKTEVEQGIYTSSTIYHIPIPLYHWRAGDGSTAQDPKNKLYAFEAGKRALEEYFKTMRIPIKSVEHTDTFGTYRARYRLEESPLVSIIIPSRDHIDDLKKTISSIRAGSYQNFEFIVVENNSEEPETFKYYNNLKKDPKIKILHYDGGFNHSVINNFGVKHAKGELILLLNNNVEMTDADSISEMVAIAERPEVGIVGARLLYTNETIQHAGIIINTNGDTERIFCGDHPDFTYGNRANCTMNYSAVEANCLMVERSIYDLVGGFDRKLTVPSNFVDFCLKVRALGKLVVYTPYARFYYNNEKKCKEITTGGQRLHTEQDINKLRNTWAEIYNTGDPYYSKNCIICCSNRNSKNN